MGADSNPGSPASHPARCLKVERIFFKIHLFLFQRQSYKEKRRHREGDDSLPKWSQLLELSRNKAKSQELLLSLPGGCKIQTLNRP